MFLKTEKEMQELNTSQIGQSACGPTSVLNVLSALDYPNLPKPSELLSFFPARLRDYNTPSIHKYLYSRAVAGTIHQEIIDTIEKITNKKIIGKFFVINSYENQKKFADWLTKIFEKKLATVFTENLFLEGNDAWHHQMGYGIKNNEIYLTNPMHRVPIYQMFQYLTAGSWMIIPNEHIKMREVTKEDVIELEKEKWDCFSVLNRIFQIKEQDKITCYGHSAYDGLTIPYGGIGGISVFCNVDNKEGMKFLEQYIEEDMYLPIYEKNIKVIKLKL